MASSVLVLLIDFSGNDQVKKKEKKISRSPFFLFIFILVFAPLAFATVEVWSLCIVEISISFLMILLLWYQFREQMQFVAVPGIIPLVLLLLWMLFQLVPLPPSLLVHLSPGSFEVYRPVYEALDSQRWLPLTVNQKATLHETIRIASYVLMYIITIQLLTSGKYLRRTVEVVVGLTIIIAFFAIIQRYTSPEHIYWFRSVPGGGTPFGPWVYRSQYSGFMAMVLPLIIGLFLYFKPRIEEEEPLQARIVTMLTAHGSNLRIFLSFGVVLVLLSILLSLSRGGILVTLLSILVFFYLLSKKSSLQFWPVLVIVSGSVVLFFITFGSEEISWKFSNTFTEEGEWNLSRLATWTDTLEIIKDFWLTGTGFGTFVDIFPVYKTIPSNSVYDHAHNDYLELLTDGGVIGFILVVWFIVVVLKGGWQKIRRRRDNFSILIGIAALVGICSMLFYSFTDFNMKNGADGLYFFFLCGLLVSASNTRFHYQSNSTLLADMSKRTKNCLLISSILLFAVVLIFPVRSFMAREMFREVESIYFSRQLSEGFLIKLSEKVKRMSGYDPLEGIYPLTLGKIEQYLKNPDRALNYYLQAAMKNPLRGEFLQSVAWMLPADQKILSEELMELSYKRSLKKDKLLLIYAEWLLRKGEKERAIPVLAEALLPNGKLLRQVRPLLLNTSFTQEEMAAILPQRVNVWVKYGDFLEKLGRVEESEFYRRHALDYLDNEKVLRAHWFSQLYSYYRKQKRMDEAIAVIRLGSSKLPEYVWFHIILGDYYKKEGILYRAREEYEQALVFEPNNEKLKQRLETLDK